MKTVAFCEQDGYARRVLKKHWPETWIYEDIRTLTARRLKQDGISPIDVVCGGFPCQDISCAGKGAGIEGSRSGLWSEMHRVIREVKPRWVIAENVPALRCRGADRVLGDLEAAGYAVWPVMVGAVHAGAPHERKRAWLVAHRTIDAAGRLPLRETPSESRSCRGGRHVPHPAKPRCQARRANSLGNRTPKAVSLAQRGQWQVEPDVGRVADGVPARVDRLRCLGNAVVPQVVAMIGQAVLEADALCQPAA